MDLAENVWKDPAVGRIVSKAAKHVIERERTCEPYIGLPIDAAEKRQNKPTKKPGLKNLLAPMKLQSEANIAQSH